MNGILRSKLLSTCKILSFIIAVADFFLHTLTDLLFIIILFLLFFYIGLVLTPKL